MPSLVTGEAADLEQSDVSTKGRSQALGVARWDVDDRGGRDSVGRN